MKNIKLDSELRVRAVEVVAGTFKLLSQLGNSFRMGMFGAKTTDAQQKVAVIARNVNNIQSGRDAYESMQSLVEHKPTKGLGNIK